MIVMPIFDVSAARAFDFKSNKGAFGHLRSLEIAGYTLDADVSVQTPLTDANANANVVGILSGIAWGSGHNPGITDPILLSVEISLANAAKVREILHRPPTEIQVTISFAVYNYDHVEEKYFVACQGAADETALKGHVRRLGNSIALEIEEDATALPQAGTKLFQLTAELEPAPITQMIALGTSATTKIVKPWGVQTSDVQATAPEEMAGTTA
jgi:hypothetical protein